MTSNELIIFNLEEIRRRSIKLWTGIPVEHYFWRPDSGAMTCLEMVRHVLEGEHLYHVIVNRRGDLGNYMSPWFNRPYRSLEDELEFAAPFREAFFATIKDFSCSELDTLGIKRAEAGQRKKLGDYLLRIGYHEAVHAGQMLSYLRTLRVDRPIIWD